MKRSKNAVSMFGQTRSNSCGENSACSASVLARAVRAGSIRRRCPSAEASVAHAGKPAIGRRTDRSACSLARSKSPSDIQPHARTISKSHTLGSCGLSRSAQSTSVMPFSARPVNTWAMPSP